MTNQTLRTGRRIGLLAGLTVAGFLGLGQVTAHSFAATPTAAQPNASITIAADDGGSPPNNGWQSGTMALRVHLVLPDSLDCDPNNGWQC